MEEYDALEKRREFMTGQLADLQASRNALDKVVAAIEGQYGYPSGDARAMAEGLLPDMLPYDPTRPVGFPENGRRLEDDTMDFAITMMSRGKVTSDGVGPHTDYLATFPYLGPPHPVAPGTVYKLPGGMKPY
jgi:hypothetical protein